MRAARVDRPLAILIAVLVFGGIFIFSSAVFGLLARGATNMYSVVFSHLALGIGGGTAALLIASRIPYRLWRRFAPHLFVFALLLTAAVFIPQLGFEHGGGRRWLLIANFSIQPAEFLKAATIIFAAAYFTAVRAKLQTLQWGFGGLLFILAGPGVILLAQPDLGTLGVIVLSALAIYIAAGARWSHIALFIVGGLVALITLSFALDSLSHARERILTFLDPSQNQQVEGYQIKQSLIAIGSGGLAGRGFGQSVQKFTYLPEPMGDSIFAVLGEEFGLIGAMTLIALYLALALRGFHVAARAPDHFGGLLAIGISTYLVAEAFINIAAMLGLAPLTGIPLTFVSQGGSAMLASLGSAGILLAISRKAARS